jgi:hypothetical protein
MSVYLVARHEIRNQIVTEIMGRGRLIMVENQLFKKKRRVEYIDAHAPERKPGMTRHRRRDAGFFIKACDSQVIVDAHDPKRARLLHRNANACYCHIRGFLHVIGQQLAIIHFVYVIAAQNQHVVRIVTAKYIDILVHRISGTLVPGFLNALLSRK